MNQDMEFLKNTCKIGKGEETCRYLSASSKGWECLKTTKLRGFIDSQVYRMGAKGDNCPGEEN